MNRYFFHAVLVSGGWSAFYWSSPLPNEPVASSSLFADSWPYGPSVRQLWLMASAPLYPAGWLALQWALGLFATPAAAVHRLFSQLITKTLGGPIRAERG